MLEGEYLELVDDLKKKFDEKDKEVEKLKEEIEQYKKNLLSIYGWCRMTDILMSEGLLEENDFINQISIMRTFLSNWYDEQN